MSESTIQTNKVVAINYRIVDESGEVVEQSDVPIEYIQGIPNPMFDKIEQALEGEKIGDTIAVSLSPEDGFGPHLVELTFTDKLENVPPEFRFVGAKPEFKNEEGEIKEFVVSKIEDGMLTVDGNNPFAGKTVTFHVDVIGVRDATESELKSGTPITPDSSMLQ